MRVLFVGNSFIYHDASGGDDLNVSGQFAQMSSRTGRNVTATSSSIGGGSFQDHWQDNSGIRARDEIASGNYDLVYMIGSLDNIRNVVRGEPGARAHFDHYADLLADLCAQNAVSSMFLSSWMTTSQIDYDNGSVIGDTAHEMYRAAAWRNGNAYAPIVVAWEEAHRLLTQRHGGGDQGQTAENLLYDDSIHPSVMGSYLVACTLYAMTFGTMPPSTSTYRPQGVSIDDANLMRQAAWNATVNSGKGEDIEGNGGNNTLNGTMLDETILGFSGNDTLSGGMGGDRLRGDAGNDRLAGNKGTDTLLGGTGNDRLAGGTGRDYLTGGGDSDIFVFAGAGANHWDTVHDFQHGVDKIQLDDGFFDLNPGNLGSGLFAFGNQAGDANDRFVYHKASGALYYDRDGAGGASKQLIALLGNGTTLTADDIFIA